EISSFQIPNMTHLPLVLSAARRPRAQSNVFCRPADADSGMKPRTHSEMIPPGFGFPKNCVLICRSIHQIIKLDHGAGALHAARVADDLLLGRAVRITLDVCLRLPFGIGDELAARARAQQLFGDAALLRNHQGGTFSLPDALRGLALRRIDLDMNET